MIFKKRDFEDLVTKTIERLKKDQEKFKSKYNLDYFDSWSYDQPSGTFGLKKGSDEVFFKFHNIGTLSRRSNTWLWAWANKHTYPNVKILSEKIKEFGLKNNYEKLIKSDWSAEEVDGWEMLSIANWILKPLGVYRIDSEQIQMFIILTCQITATEAESLKVNSKQLVDCGNHGLRRAAFVCQHLEKTSKIGFNEAFDTWENMMLQDDDDFQAWCNECEKIRIKNDGWNDESMNFAKIKVICETCYFEIKKINL